MGNKANHYSIYPAAVRYDKRLSDGAYRLYGEITAALNTDGECSEDNEYFTEKTGKTDRTIYRYLKELETYGHIQRVGEEGKRRIALPKQIIDYIAPDKPKPKLVEKDFFDEFIDRWNEVIGAKQHKLDDYRKLLTARLQVFTKEELLKAIEHRKSMMDSTEWYQKPENKKHYTRVELLIRDDKRVQDALNHVPEEAAGKSPDMKKETFGFRFD